LYYSGAEGSDRERAGQAPQRKNSLDGTLL
jgi:hypothetical protein